MEKNAAEIKNGTVEFGYGDIRNFSTPLTEFNKEHVIFKLDDSLVTLKLSDILEPFSIFLDNRALYQGKAVVVNLIVSGSTTICQAKLEDGWGGSPGGNSEFSTETIRQNYDNFVNHWQVFYRLAPEYKVIIADMYSFLNELKLYLEGLDLRLNSLPRGEKTEYEQKILLEVGRPAIQLIDWHFERFESAAHQLAPEHLPIYKNLMRRMIHPLVLGAPFPNRTFRKPLGYAGDYQIVKMMSDNAYEGSSLHEKIVHKWFVEQPPAEAHRNRLKLLTEKIVKEAVRVHASGQKCKVLNIGCGPAIEVQNFLENHRISDETEFTLLDFNEETLEYAKSRMEAIKETYRRQTTFNYLKKSVNNIFKENLTETRTQDRTSYHMIYCAGLFDYLSDAVCEKLMQIFYQWLLPDGLLIATNVTSRNPLRHGMEHLLDWHLTYRDAAQAGNLIPKEAPAELCRLASDITGINLFIEIRKGSNG